MPRYAKYDCKHRRSNLVASQVTASGSPGTPSAQPLPSQCDLCAHPRRCSCGIARDLTALLLWRHYVDPTMFLSEYRETAFVLYMLKVCAVARRSMRSQRVYWWCHLVLAAMFEIALRTPWCSTIFSDVVGTPCERNPSVTGAKLEIKFTFDSALKSLFK